ncbi:MAG TPA: YwiC-like family protein [Polyangiaceae bacterium]|nr:YwiC-like family protein [Polyangiaceae bacterium]
MNTSTVTIAGAQTVVAHPSRGPASPVVPREHGALGQAVVPLVVGLGLGTPRFAALGIAVAALLLFLAHEPLVLLLGQRGRRQQRERSPQAKRWLGVLVSAAIGIGGASALAVGWQVLLACLACITMAGVVLVAFMMRGRERTAMGEVSVAITLPSALVPVAMASNVAAATALVCWSSLSLAYVAGVFGVRGIVGSQRKRSSGVGAVASGWSGLTLSLLALASIAAFSTGAALAGLVFGVIVAAIRWKSPSLRHMRRVGWVLVGANLAQAIILITWIR